MASQASSSTAPSGTSTESRRSASPVFAAGSVPTPPGRDRSGNLDVPVSCGGLKVRPGDYVYGDTDGVVVVPQAQHDEILARLNGR